MFTKEIIVLGISLVLLGGCSVSKKVGDHEMSYISEDSVEEFDVGKIFARYKELNNSGSDMGEVLTLKMEEFYAEVVEENGGRQEIISFDRAARFGNLGMVKFRLMPYGSSKEMRGWLVAEIEGGKIDFFGAALSDPPVGRFVYDAEGGQLADTAATAVALSSGFVEGNPMMSSIIDAGGIPALGVIKVGATYIAKKYSLESCVVNSPGLSGMGWGAAGWNLALIAGAGPAAMIPAFGLGWYFWPDSDETFWDCIPEEAHRYALEG